MIGFVLPNAVGAFWVRSAKGDRRVGSLRPSTVSAAFWVRSAKTMHWVRSAKSMKRLHSPHCSQFVVAHPARIYIISAQCSQPG
jgi:hypothetical protein